MGIGVFRLPGINPLADPDYDGGTTARSGPTERFPTNAASVLSVDARLFGRLDDQLDWATGQLPTMATNLQIVPTWASNGVLHRFHKLCRLDVSRRGNQWAGEYQLPQRKYRVLVQSRLEWRHRARQRGAPHRDGGHKFIDGWWSLGLIPQARLFWFQSKSNALDALFHELDRQLVVERLVSTCVGPILRPRQAFIQTECWRKLDSGMTNYPDLGDRSTYGFSIGADHTGQFQARGIFRQLLNIQRPVERNVHQCQYQAMAGPSGSGLGDYIEWAEGWNPFASGIVADTNNVIGLQTYTPLQ